MFDLLPVPQLKLVVLLVATKLSSFAQGFLNVPVPEYCIYLVGSRIVLKGFVT